MLSSLLSSLLLAALSMNEPINQEQAVILAKQAASKHLNLPVEQLTVQQAQAIDWPDSSLGCPQPGMMYLQVITPGFKVLLKAAEKTYPVHVGGAHAVVCAGDAGAARGAKAQSAQAKADLVKRARERLAALLKAPIDDIQVHAIRAGKAGDASSCANGVSQEKTAGKLVELEYAGRRYQYRAESDDVQECTQ